MKNFTYRQECLCYDKPRIMRIWIRLSVLVLTSLITSYTLSAQQTGAIGGTVTDESGQPLIAATVFLQNTTIGTTTDVNGKYLISDISPDTYTLQVSYVGFSTTEQTVRVEAGKTTTANAQLGEDALQMEEVIITGAFDERTKLESSVAITTLNTDLIEQRSPRGTGDLLAAVPGTFVDGSSGEIGSLVYARGLSSGARGLPGFHYVSLQEDGLPVLSTQYQFNFVDMHHRNDATVARFEGIRGGSASIASGNAPGGIFNFISKEGTDKVEGLVKLQGGVQGNGHPFTRADFNMGGPLNKTGWYSNFGGFYRFDEGARDLPYNANVGGQLKFNLMRKHDKGKLKFYGKFLNDRVTRYGHIPVVGTGTDIPLESPDTYANFNLNHSAFYPNYQAENIPDGERWLSSPTATRSYDSDRAVETMNISFGSSLSYDVGRDFIIKNNLKYSYGKVNYFQYAGNVVLDTETGLFDFYGFPPLVNLILNDFTYTDTATDEVLFNKNDDINLIGNQIYAGAALHSRNDVHDIINQFSLTKELNDHRFTVGAYASMALVDILWNGDALLGTLNANSRTFHVGHPNLFEPDNPDRSTLDFSDPQTGVIAYGSQYNKNEATSSTLALFGNEVWEVSKRLTIDAGLRYETVIHSGKKERYDVANEVLPSTGVLGGAFLIPDGIDANYATFYDAGTRYGTGEYDDYQFNYSYLSGSLGLNYKLNEGLATYARFTRGNKAPELGYYILNFENQEITKGFTEKIYMGELGVKFRTRPFALFLTGFYSRMNDVAFQLVVPGQDGILVFTPTTFNDIQTLGTEIEAIVRPVKNLSLRLSMTLQNPRFADFTYYNINGTADPIFIGDVHPEDPNVEGFSPYPNANGEPIEAGAPSDDFTEDFSGNVVSDVPKMMVDFTATYRLSRFNIFANWRYTGERAANRRNTLTLPHFSVFNAGAEGQLTERISLAVKVNNLFNSAGLMNFDGLGFLGQTPEDVTPELIAANAAADNPHPYFVRPILPRMMSGTVTYRF